MDMEPMASLLAVASNPDNRVLLCGAPEGATAAPGLVALWHLLVPELSQPIGMLLCGTCWGENAPPPPIYPPLAKICEGTHEGSIYVCGLPSQWLTYRSA